MSKVPRFKEGKSFKITDLNRLVDGVNEVKDTYDEGQRIIHEMKKILTTYQGSVSHFLDRYATLIHNTPEIMELIKYHQTKPVYAPIPHSFFAQGDNLYVKYSELDPGTLLGPILNFRGLPGEPGKIGPQGIPGNTGPKGEVGPTTLYTLHHAIINGNILPSKAEIEADIENPYEINRSVVQVIGTTTLPKGPGLYLWTKDNTTGAVGWEFIGEYQMIQGPAGRAGREVLLSIDHDTSTLQWRYTDDTIWTPLIALPSYEEWQSQVRVRTDDTLVGDGTELFPLGVSNNNSMVQVALDEHKVDSSAHMDIRNLPYEVVNAHNIESTSHNDIRETARLAIEAHRDSPTAHQQLFDAADMLAESKINSHNILPTSHLDIRNDAHTELVDHTTDPNAHPGLTVDVSNQIDSKVVAHNVNSTAHTDIRQALDTLNQELLESLSTIVDGYSVVDYLAQIVEGI